MGRRRLSALGAGLLACAATPAVAQKADTTPEPSAPTESAETQQAPKAPATLTGEWGGVRTDLRDAGVDVAIGYTSEFGANVSGGAKHDATETGQFTFGVTIDTAKLFGLKGGTIQGTVTYRRGDDLDQVAGLGTLQQVQEVYGRGQTWRLTELWWQQDLGSGFDLKAGRMPQGADFNSFSCTFMNLAFCGAPAGNIAGDYWFNWPIAQWAGRLRYKRPDWYVMAGVYENNQRNLDNAFFISRGGASGVLIPVEAGWTPKLHGLPGSYRIGGWYTTSNAPDVLTGTDRRPFAISGLEPIEHSGRYGAYLLMQQQLTGTWADAPDGPKATHGLSVFLNITHTDRNTERTDEQIAAGLFFAGPFKIRPDDDLGFGIARTQVNSRCRARASACGGWSQTGRRIRGRGLLQPPSDALADCASERAVRDRSGRLQRSQGHRGSGGEERRHVLTAAAGSGGKTADRRSTCVIGSAP